MGSCSRSTFIATCRGPGANLCIEGSPAARNAPKAGRWAAGHAPRNWTPEHFETWLQDERWTEIRAIVPPVRPAQAWIFSATPPATAETVNDDIPVVYNSKEFSIDVRRWASTRKTGTAEPLPVKTL